MAFFLHKNIFTGSRTNSEHDAFYELNLRSIVSCSCILNGLKLIHLVNEYGCCALIRPLDLIFVHKFWMGKMAWNATTAYFVLIMKYWIFILCNSTNVTTLSSLCGPKVIRQPFALDRLKIAKKENTLYLIYMSDWDVAVAAFTLQSPEAKVNRLVIKPCVAFSPPGTDCCVLLILQNWFESFTKAKHLYARLKFTHENSPVDNLNIRYQSNETLGIRKSPLNSSMGSRLSSLNNSHR